MQARVFVVRAPGEPERVGRTLRALAAAGIAGEDTGGDLARVIGQAGGAVWLVRAGAWPAPGIKPVDPTPSATGRPLVAFGGVLSERGAELDVGASVYLEAEPAQHVARRLAGGCTFDEAISAVLDEDERWRVVRFAPLDVRYDPGLRVVQVITSLQRGGAERLTLDLAVALGWHGVSCRLVVLGHTSRQVLAVPSGMDVVDLSPLSGDRRARAEAVGKVARDVAADVVHGHLLEAEEARIVSAQGVPLVLTVHNQRPGWPAGLATLGAGEAALLVACARAVETELAGAAAPVRTAWNGVDPKAFAPSPARRAAGRAFRRRLGIGSHGFVLLALANPRPQKRLERLPGVLAALRAELAQRGVRRDACLVIAGEASATSPASVQTVEAVRSEAARLGLAGRIVWAGSVSDVAVALAAADVLVSTSDHEGLSLAQLEALAAGVPVVATDAGGVAEIAPGQTAAAVLPRDASPEAFATRLADRAVAPIRTTLPADFTRATMAARYVWLYPRAIAAARTRRGGDGLLLVTNNFSIGGAQTSARRLLIGLAARGVRARAIVIQELPAKPTPGRCALAKAGIPVVALAPSGSVDPAVAVARLLGLADDDPPAAVLLWNVIPEYRVLIADGLLGTPLFDVSPGALSFDALDRYFTRPRAGLPYRTAAEYGARLAGAIVKYHAEVPRAAATLGVPVHVIPNGVPIDAAVRRSCDGRLVIGTAARINPHKRLDLLIDAVRRAHPKLPPYVLRVAGGVERDCDEYARALRAQANGLPVEWLGGLDETTEFLRGLDLFALVAEPAGCPNASLEAMAAGLPVIATDAGGMAEQVEDGVTGRLVGREDVGGLADALVETANDRGRRVAWGEAGRRRVVERFGLERMVEDYARVCLRADE
ncbi:MAG: glycosyltransferase [Isosphaeraceae bacterium]|nr:glycosyltransferase [Isosphaeraceae bacterium]